MTGPPLKETLSGYPLKRELTRFFTVFLFLIACLLAICTPCPHLYANQTKSVLVLHSYNKGLEWTDYITQGIEAALGDKGQDIEFHFEYMDTKRVYDDKYLQHVYELYRHKFRHRRFDVIISSDNHVFNLLLAHHRELFPDTPVVFCGVNDFQDSMLDGHELITGVAEVFDIRSTLDVALKLQPEIKEVVVITDKTDVGKIGEGLMLKVIPHFNRLRFTFWKDLDMSEIRQRAEKLPRDSILFLLSFTADRSGNFFPLISPAN